ncbi:hypothetical protein DEI91_00630 [Curtobacterium sp. MCBD17_032]|nr:hypothetical protein DEI91_00630 [Curtobacterium sp. MCBD17_032]
MVRIERSSMKASTWVSPGAALIFPPLPKAQVRGSLFDEDRLARNGPTNPSHPFGECLRLTAVAALQDPSDRTLASLMQPLILSSHLPVSTEGCRMPPRVKSSDTIIGEAIRARRISLGHTVEVAATRAGVGAKSWARYESGASIRADKVRGVCRALGWASLEAAGAPVDDDDMLDVDDSHKAWSPPLAERLGDSAAAVFAVGSDLVYDTATDELRELARLPRGSHLGQLDVSWFVDELPAQFLTRYDYEFMFALRGAVRLLRERAAVSLPTATSVLQELALAMILGQAEVFADTYPASFPDDEDSDWKEWFAELQEDTDALAAATSERPVSEQSVYHFDHWNEDQFNV